MPIMSILPLIRERIVETHSKLGSIHFPSDECPIISKQKSRFHLFYATFRKKVIIFGCPFIDGD